MQNAKGLLTGGQTPGAWTGLALLLARLVAGYTWYWGWSTKAPWINWGWLLGYLYQEARYTQLPQYQAFLLNVAIPNINTLGWMAFIIEVTLSVTLAIGFLTGITGLVASIWAANAVFGSYPVPGELWFNLLNLLILPIVIWLTRAGRFMGIDAYTRPNLLAIKSRVLRWLGKYGT